MSTTAQITARLVNISLRLTHGGGQICSLELSTLDKDGDEIATSSIEIFGSAADTVAGLGLGQDYVLELRPLVK